MLEWTSTMFSVSVWFFFEVFHIMGHSLFNSIFIFNSFIPLFILFSVLLWCLFRAPLSSCICFCVLSYSLFLVSWNFLSVSCSFWLTMSRIFSMEFSVISCKMSYLRVFLWASLGSLVSFVFVLLGSGTWCPFYSFSLNYVLNYFLRKVVSIPSSSSHHSTWCCVIMFLIG
jgi:hypothetical protein